MKKTLYPILAAAGLLCLASCGGNGSSCQDLGYDPDGQVLQIGDDIAVAQTQYGTVRGYIVRNVYTYLGIPYGASTAGENRFMPPQPPTPWEGVLNTIYWGDSAPQSEPSFSPSGFGAFRDHWNYGAISEDCLRLNVWTPGTDSEKRPVLVWMHGGGYSAGNGVEQDGYLGENFARQHDAVFVSVNHRLNAFGFSNFAGVCGEEFAHSGNVGMLDLVAALQWVHDNIANFGGDPGNVTIMGQSGGGSKVCTTLAMPAAKGLVHKAVPLSGNSTTATNKELSEGLGAYILQKAGLKPSEIGKLQQMPWKEYLALANSAASEYAKVAGRRVGFSPVANDVDIPVGTFYTLGREDVADVPMLLCSTTNEFTSSAANSALEAATREDIVSQLSRNYGENAGAIYDAYDQLFPGNTPFGISSIVASSRDGVLNTAKAKLTQNSPVYVAWFGWYPELFDNRMRAFHCLDICFWFNNTDLMITHTGGGKAARDLSTKMGNALEAFMRTGNPNSGKKNSLPEWPAFTAENGATMILDNTSVVKNNPDAEARALMGK